MLTALYFLGFSLPAATAAAPVISALTDEVQSRIVQLYSDNKCQDVRDLLAGNDLSQLRPNIMAIAAVCETPGEDPEALFTKAETLNPTGDLILVLHAKYRSRRNPKSADGLWQKLMLTARNEYFRQLAKDHLSGVVNEKEEGPLNLSQDTLFTDLSLAGLFAENSRVPELANRQSKASYGTAARGFFSYRHWKSFGYWGVNATVTYNNYASNARSNFWTNFLGTPISIHVADDKDISFRPYVGYQHLGTRAFRFLYGLAFNASVFKNIYKQSVQASYFTDRVWQPSIHSTEGAHYRFEYQWDFFPRNWYYKANIFVEHVSGSNTDRFFGHTGKFIMSHTDGGFDTCIDRELGRFTVGLQAKWQSRVDSDESEYLRPRDGTKMVKQRLEFDYAGQFNAAFKLTSTTQVFAWFEHRRIESNIDDEDYVDFRFTNNTVGLGVKASLSTY